MFNNVRIGIAPINWTNDDLPELGGEISFEDCIREMAEAGYEGCEVGNKYPRDPEVLKAALAPHNLQVAGAWISTFFTEPHRADETLNAFIEHKKFLKAMGASVINVCECGNAMQHTSNAVMHHRPHFTKEQWKALIDGLHRCAEIAKEDDMDIVYHSHLGTGIQTDEEIEYLMENTKEDHVSLLVDTGHMISVGADPVETIHKYHDRIKHIHLKDLRKDVLKRMHDDHISFLDGVKEGLFTVPGDGFIDFIAFFKALANYNYVGWMIVEAEQDPAKAHPLTYAKKGREYIRQHTGI